MKKVAVLLAAYNGAAWVEEQIGSILDQVGVEVTIFVSLDKSDDNTKIILDDIANKYVNVVVLPHGHVFGCAAKNFYYLIRNVDFSQFDYVSLSDQDDIWDIDKLSRAVGFLSEFSVYSSNVTAFYSDGRRVLIDKAQPQVTYDYLFEAAGPGCTYVMTAPFIKEFQAFIIQNESSVNQVALHDWLLYAFARSHKYAWYIDVVPKMEYRQHANNQVGANNTFAAAAKRLLLIKNKWYRTQVVRIAGLLGFSNHPLMTQGLLNGYVGNLYLLMRIREFRRRLRDRVALALVLFFNLF